MIDPLTASLSALAVGSGAGSPRRSRGETPPIAPDPCQTPQPQAGARFRAGVAFPIAPGPGNACTVLCGSILNEPPVPFGSMAYDNGHDHAPWCTVEVITESTCQFRVLWLQS